METEATNLTRILTDHERRLALLEAALLPKAKAYYCPGCEEGHEDLNRHYDDCPKRAHIKGGSDRQGE